MAADAEDLTPTLRGRHVPASPPAGVRLRRRIRLGPSLVALWHSRELVRSMTERELRSRYKQAFLGAAWALVSPLALMLVFALFVNAVADVNTGGAPYALFSFIGLIPWTFFSTSISNGGLSLLNNTQLLNKVYCPREIFPLSSVCVGLVDSCISILALLGLFAITRYMPGATSYWIVPLLAIQLAFTIGVTLLLSSIVIYFRDLRHALPLLLQLGIFATPVAYGLDSISEGLRPLYCAVNPLAAVIDGYRRSVLLGVAPRSSLTLAAAASATVFLLVGYAVFKRLEVGIADFA